jgi:hypothetical protein
MSLVNIPYCSGASAYLSACLNALDAGLLASGIITLLPSASVLRTVCQLKKSKLENEKITLRWEL